MICRTCGSDSSRVVSRGGEDSCPSCSGISEAGGARTSGILTRNSLRVRTESVRSEGDTLPAHRYDRASRKWVPSEDFLRLHPGSASNVLTEGEARKAGLPGLAAEITRQKAEKRKAKADHRSGTETAGDTAKAVRRRVEQL